MKYTPLLCALLLAACSENSDPSAVAAPADPEAVENGSLTASEGSPRLELMWRTAGFDAPEGVAMAPDGAYFISNISGGEDAKDGEGWISKLAADGGVAAQKFIAGLDAPKGMAVLAGVLYVADIDQVRSFDAETGAAIASIAIPGGRFLNDATVWRDEIYVSDSATGRIWRLAPEGPVIWREGEELSGVNGLLGDGDRMLVSTMTSGGLYEASPDGDWREIASGMNDADGIGLAPTSAGGGYLVSAWPGEVFRVTPEGTVSSLLNTRAEGVLQNDLTIFGDIVIIPNWEPGTVTAWRLSR